MIKKWFGVFLLVSVFSFFGISSSHADVPITSGAPLKTLECSNSPDAQRIQGAAFQPVLLAFDRDQNRLFIATPAENSSGSLLLLFQDPERDAPSPQQIISLTGTASGLSYHAESKTLFMANAGEGEILIFDRFDGNRSKGPTRVLRKFNFPTGIEAEPSSQRLFIADAHPGAVLVFENMHAVQGTENPSLTMGPETGLNGPFDLAGDIKGGRLYVSNFDGVLVFDLNDLKARPDRLPFSRNTLARGLAFDPKSKKLYIAAPMRRSYFIYDGTFLEEIKLDGVRGPFPFSLAIDVKSDRLYLAGTGPRVGVIERISKRPSPNRALRRKIDRWIPWAGASPSPPSHPEPRQAPEPSEDVPSVITLPFDQPDLNHDPSPISLSRKESRCELNRWARVSKTFPKTSPKTSH